MLTNKKLFRKMCPGDAYARQATHTHSQPMFLRLCMILLLSLVGMGSAWAEEVTIDLSSSKTWPVSGITFDGGTFGNSSYQLSESVGGNITVSIASGSMTKIEFTYASNSTDRTGGGSSITVDSGNYSLDGSSGTWEGIAQSVKFSYINKVRITSAKITYTNSATEYVTVSYGANNDSYGTVTAKYTTGGENFVSGTDIVKNTSLTFTATPKLGYKFNISQDNPWGKATSTKTNPLVRSMDKNATYTAVFVALANPTISAQPVGATYAKDESASALSITAAPAEGGSLAYQWYKNTANSTDGATAISGETNSTYTPSTAAGGTTYYYCVVTENVDNRSQDGAKAYGAQTTTSDIVAVSVNVPVTSIKTVEGTTTTWDFTKVTQDMAATLTDWTEDNFCFKNPAKNQYWTPSWCEGIGIGVKANGAADKVRVYYGDGTGAKGVCFNGGDGAIKVTVPAGANMLEVYSDKGIAASNSVKFTSVEGVYSTRVTPGQEVVFYRTDGSATYITKIVTKSVPTYTITYDLNGHGDAITEVTDATNLPVEFPIPTATGYDFGGWYTDGGLADQDRAVAGAAISANTILYAKWTAKVYEIKYPSFNGTHGANHPTRHTYGTATPLVSPTKDGYTFAGWYTTSDCTGEAITEIGATQITDNINLYAKWGAARTEIGKIRTTGDGCNKDVVLLYNGDHNYLKMTAAEANDAAISLTGLTTDDYDVIISGDQVIDIEKHVFDNRQFYVKITAKNGVTGTANVKINFKGNSEYLPKESPEVAITVAEAVTLNYTVSDGGSVSAVTPGGTVKSSGSTVAKGTNITFTANRTSGYLFDNWHDGSQYISENPYTVTVISDINLNATFIESRVINVALAPGNESMGTVALYARNTQTPNLSGVEIKKNVNLDFTATANGEYTFLGWRTNAEGTGEFISTAATYQVKAESVATGTTYYAYFSAVPTDPTKVGAEDNSSAYNSAHSQVYPLATGKTRHISFVNHSAKGENWYNWILSVASAENLTTTTPDIMILRADNWDNLNTDADHNSETASAFDWSTFQNDMDGATVAMDVTNSGSHIYVNATINTTGGKTYKYSAITKDHTYGENAYLCLTVEFAHLTGLSVEDEAKAYELSFGLMKQGEEGEDHIECGDVVIKNKQNLVLPKGTFVPLGETVNYAVVSNPGYQFTQWTSGITLAERDIEVSGGAIQEGLVTPRAVFAINYVVTTQPVNASYNYKATATALTVATNAGTPTYQWYSNTVDDNTKGQQIVGATEASYIPQTTTPGATYYYCVMTDAAFGSVTSATAKIEVTIPKPSVSVHENIIAITSSVDGAKYYYTLDKSDPASSATRIEYAPNAVAIREGMTKIRAVTYVDGYYSAVQGQDIKAGTSVQYEHVTVLEARGVGIPANGTFTNDPSETSKAFKNAVPNDFSNIGGNYISPNSLDQEGDRTSVFTTNANVEPYNTYTIGINSSSATKIVIGAGSNSENAQRSLTSIYVDGIKVTGYTVTGTSGYTKDLGRIVIKGLDIPQGSDITFNFSGKTSIYYYEIFGESNENMCKKPEVVPTSFDGTKNIWNYTIKNQEPESTLHYVIVDLNAAEDARIKGSGESTSDIILSSTEGLADGYMIRAWSTKDGYAQSSRSFAYVESELTPTIKFNIKEAKYNKDINNYTTEVPVLSVYPSSLLASVTFLTDDQGVGYGTDGNSAITIGSGQGVTIIKANLVVAENSNGVKVGSYSASLKLVVSDGIAYALSESEKGTRPKIRTTVELKDPANDQLLLTMMYGGYKYKNGQFDGETKDGKDVFDSWGKISAFSGYGDNLSSDKKYVDGYSWNSQASQDARSEAYVDRGAGSKVWYSTSETKPDGTSYAKYERIKPFSLPVRGAYFTFEPQENGVLTLYVLQNGSLNTNREGEDGHETDYVTGISANPRAYYWFDQDGYRIEPASVTVKQPLTFGTDAKTYAGTDVISTTLSNWKGSDEYANDAAYRESLDKWGNQEAVENNLQKSDPDPQPIIRYQEGFCILQKAYVKYVVNVVAGKTYYFFSNNSKLGFAGVNFKKVDLADVNVDDRNLTMTQTDNVNSITKNTVYKSATLARTFKKNTWNTITLPFALSERQIEKVFGYGTKVVLYNGTTGTDNSLKVYFLEHVDQNILPGQPYFILPTGVDEFGNDLPSVSADEKIGGNGNAISFTNVFVPSNVALQSYGNNTYADKERDNVRREDFTFEGTFSPTRVNKYDYFMNATSGELTQYIGSGLNLNTYRAYLKATEKTNAKVISSINFDSIFDIVDNDEDESEKIATGLMNLLVNEMNVEIKPMNGVYNLNGQKVSESTKDLPTGIYIVNGKKISIK